MLNHPFLAGNTPLVMAHRGGGAEVPENSWQSLEHTVALGLTHIETDTHATTDGVLVLHHDDTLDGTTDASGPIAARSWRELATVRDASGGGLVRLEEALERFPDLRFNIDAKSLAAVGPLAAAAARHPERILIASFSTTHLAQARRLAPDVATSLSQGEVTRLVALSRLPLDTAVGLGRRHPALRHAVAVQIPPRHRGIPVLTSRLVALAHELALAVHIWGADDAATWHSVLASGADGIITDHPTAALSWLARQREDSGQAPG